MNIFFVDSCPLKAAQSLCDKHVVKMILESAQLLCTSHHLYPKSDIPSPFYKPTHKNHPCTKWVCENISNYLWLGRHARGLLDEYTNRYKKIHASTNIINWCLNNEPNISRSLELPYVVNSWMLTYPAQAMPDEYKITNDPIEAYRQYYREVKLKTIKCVWTNREKPKWL